ncbi:serine/threonine protein kinase [Colletotrichum salicis]|uniref:Serine/threonine protein kinase n=1 Tax=Colletotrichum salicis TaxID=1209931 RepID=A0A135UBU5_9PEZI|nr:serine/threonine protein kinase [Colletotrichum salicis]
MKQDGIIADFKRYVDQYVHDNDCHGMRGYEDSRVAFVPRCALESFWTMENVNSVLYDREDWIKGGARTIQGGYLQVFSILAYMSQPQHISLFTGESIQDGSLPLKEIPRAFSEAVEKSVFEEFEKEQWRFCPFLFDTKGEGKPHKRHLPPLQIIPIIAKKRIDHSESTYDDYLDRVCVFHVTLHPLCFDQQEVVFKTYRDVDAEVIQAYENEVNLYTQLDEQPTLYDSKSIIRYFGSFEIPSLRTVILEYAGGGNLKSFFESCPPPLARSDRVLFWDNLMGLLGGLDAIHNLKKSQGGKGTWLILYDHRTHQDIRPQNILVCPDQSGNIYAAEFKFVDMGNGHIRRSRNQGMDLNAEDNWGNGMYSAPEAYRDYGDSRSIRWESDVWSLGAVASEALVWTRWGESRLKGGFHEGAFHDGDPDGPCLLNSVDEWHCKATSYAGDESHWFLAVSRFLLSGMLSMDPRERIEAFKLHTAWKSKVFNGPDLVEPHEDLHRALTKSSWPYSASRRRRETTPLSRLSVENSPETVDPTHSIGSRSESNPDIILQSPEEMRNEIDPETACQQNAQMPQRFNTVPHRLKHGSGGFWNHEDHLYVPGANHAASENNRGSFHWHGTPELRPVEHFANALNIEAQATAPTDVRNEAIGAPGQPTRPSIASNPTMNVFRDENLPGQQERLPSYTPQLGPFPPNQAQWNTDPTFPHEANIDILTMATIYNVCIEGKDRPRSPFRRSPSTKTKFKGRPLEAFPQLVSALQKLKGEKGRDQMFLVDDSRSMLPHRQKVATSCQVLSYLLKKGEVDPNATFEVYFTSSHPPLQSTRTSELKDNIERLVFHEDQCNMAPSLDELVSKAIQNKKPVSIYVLTNGHWNLKNQESFCGVEGPIKRLVTHVRQTNEQQNWIGVQFIRFFHSQANPDDKLGETRLKALDDDLKQQTGIDIVDARDFDADVRKILLGSVVPDEDNS